MTGAAGRISAAGLLDADQMKLIHQEALHVLRNHGVEINHPSALSHLADSGCRVDFESGMTTFPEDLIESGLAAAPREIKLRGRDPGLDITLRPGGDAMATRSTGGMAHIHRPGADCVAPLDQLDAARFYRLIQGLENLEIVAPIYPQKVMPAIRDLDALLTMLENTTKPVNCQPESTTGLQLLGEAAVILRGSVDAVREDPPFMLLEAPISPLKFPRVFVDTLLMAGEYGIPVEICPLPTGGATGPLTVAGSLLLTVVEHLAAITLIQTLYPGTPVIWAPRYAAMDMSTGNTGLGVEGVLASAAAAQLVGEYYGMIGDLYGPVSNGLLSDGKAVLESVLAGCTTALLGCPALLCGAGVLEVGLVACLEQLVIDNEIHGWIKRLFSWIKADQLTEIPHIEDLEGIFHKSGRNPAPSDPIVFRDWVEDRVKSKTLESEISPLDENIRRELKQLMMSQLN